MHIIKRSHVAFGRIAQNMNIEAIYLVVFFFVCLVVCLFVLHLDSSKAKGCLSSLKLVCYHDLIQRQLVFQIIFCPTILQHLISDRLDEACFLMCLK